MPSIETARLLLRMFKPEDLDELAALFSDPEVMRYVASGQPAAREEVAKALASIIKHWERHGYGRWAVVGKKRGNFIGMGGLRSLFGTTELVYHLAPAHWGNGLATELAKASLRYGFEERRSDRIIAVAKPPNAASIQVMKKVGMHFEKYANYYDIDVVQYSISADEFQVDDSTYVLRLDEQFK